MIDTKKWHSRVGFSSGGKPSRACGFATEALEAFLIRHGANFGPLLAFAVPV